ncbi:Hypothetical protein D9617_14g076320 [Elsinoe fawcettii]|nr:Hypothetical protein D9617_14g076320 [Elsinoe fawcettii]
MESNLVQRQKCHGARAVNDERKPWNQNMPASTDFPAPTTETHFMSDLCQPSLKLTDDERRAAQDLRIAQVTFPTTHECIEVNRQQRQSQPAQHIHILWPTGDKNLSDNIRRRFPGQVSNDSEADSSCGGCLFVEPEVLALNSTVRDGPQHAGIQRANTGSGESQAPSDTSSTSWDTLLSQLLWILNIWSFVFSLIALLAPPDHGVRTANMVINIISLAGSTLQLILVACRERRSDDITWVPWVLNVAQTAFSVLDYHSKLGANVAMGCNGSGMIASAVQLAGCVGLPHRGTAIRWRGGRIAGIVRELARWCAARWNRR